MAQCARRDSNPGSKLFPACEHFFCPFFFLKEKLWEA